MAASFPLSGPTAQQRHADRTRPEATAVLRQRWENLFLAHWRWDAAIVQRTLPPGLKVDTYHGGAWVGVVALALRDVRPQFLPALPFISDYLELGVRTYVYDVHGRPGLFFYSIDCNQPLVVEGARRVLHLNYAHSTMRRVTPPDGAIQFFSQRSGTGIADVFHYHPRGHAVAPAPGTLEEFLVDRYRVFTSSPDGNLQTLRAHHTGFGLRSGEAILLDPVSLRFAGFDPKARTPDHIALADPVEVEFFMPESVEPSARRSR